MVTGKSSTENGTATYPSGTITWKLSGNNADSYAQPNSVGLRIVDPPVGTPELTVSSPDTNGQIGKMSIFAKCSHPGTLYYIASQDYNKTEVNYTEIKEVSEDLYVS